MRIHRQIRYAPRCLRITIKILTPDGFGLAEALNNLPIYAADDEEISGVVQASPWHYYAQWDCYLDHEYRESGPQIVCGGSEPM
jgi:hypothetical protein